MMPSNHLILCHPLLLLPSIFPSIRVFSKESVLPIRWPKYWNLSFSISEYWFLPKNIQGWFSLALTGLISLLSKGLSTLLQHHSLKASILWHSPFFMVQFSQLYVTTGKIIALTIQTFVRKGMSLLFNMLSRFAIGEGNGNPLQYSCLENPRDRGAWWAAVYGVAQSRTRLKWLSSSRFAIAFLPRSNLLLVF